MYRAEEIRRLHLEVTDRCNAACPMCLRNIRGGLESPEVARTEMRLEDFQNTFPVVFLRRLRHLYMCGNLGDPIAARDTQEIFRYVRHTAPAVSLGMHTNGSGRTVDWWTGLGELLYRPDSDFVRFSIDGLEDTNHLYRRGTNWAKIMESAEAFIRAGGQAIWEFLVFRHNQHQVEEARALAEKMGFARFIPKMSARFYDTTDNTTDPRYLVLDKELRGDYYLEEASASEPARMPPQASPHRRDFPRRTDAPPTGDVDVLVGGLDGHLNTAEIACQAADSKAVYVDARGRVFPCCWTAVQVYKWFDDFEGWQFREYLRGHGGVEGLESSRSSLSDIIAGPFFQDIPNRWSGRVSEGRLAVCARSCGRQCDQTLSEYPEDERERWGKKR